MRLKYKIILFIIGIFIVSGLGVSYSYYQFMIEVKNSNLEEFKGNASKLLEISYNSVKVEGLDLFPGDSIEKDINIKVIPSVDDKDVKFKIELKINPVENGFLVCKKDIDNPCQSTYKDEEICSLYSENNCSSSCVINKCLENEAELTYTFYEVDKNGDVVGEIKTASLLEKNDKILLSPIEGITKTVNEETTFNYKLIIKFEDTNEPQNHNINKEFSGNVNVNLIG